jgi:hypothetical protein
MIFDDELKNRIQQMFSLPCNSFTTRGMQDGIIIRFKTFYLKIYDENMSYDIKGYKYNEEQPVFEEIVSENKMREFCSKFKKEDYLMSIKN